MDYVEVKDNLVIVHRTGRYRGVYHNPTQASLNRLTELLKNEQQHFDYEYKYVVYLYVNRRFMGPSRRALTRLASLSEDSQ